jgi:hypothetical protein
MGEGRERELLRLPVTTNGIELGRTVAVLVDRDGRVVGFELVCRDGARRFLPAGAADIGATEIRVASALVFLGERELTWYRKRTTAA